MHQGGKRAAVIDVRMGEDDGVGLARVHRQVAVPLAGLAAFPLEEAALGPLLTRSQAWVQSICETEKISLVEKFYRVKIESLYSVKSFTNDVLSDQLKMYAKKTWEIYRWAK